MVWSRRPVHRVAFVVDGEQLAISGLVLDTGLEAGCEDLSLMSSFEYIFVVIE